MTDTNDDRLRSRRAVEALRAGVPSRFAVEVLGAGQPAIEGRVRQQLEEAARTGVTGRQTPGLLIAGGFGSGKSHLLEYIEHLALQENFICSKVVISKETPLYDPIKVYRAAIAGAVVPGRRGAALTEVISTLNVRSEAYHDLLTWAHPAESGLNARFAALTYLLDVVHAGMEARERVVAHLAGDPLGVAQLRAWLREARADTMYKLTPIANLALTLERFRYVPRLFTAAGYAGWVLLFDEVELIGRYSVHQRARSYAQLARWLGKDASGGFPGITAVLAITSDFAAAVLEPGGKHDLEVIPNRLRAGTGRDDPQLARLVERGMGAIRRDAVNLRPPDRAALRRSYDQVRALHAHAYDWDPPDVKALERLSSTRMREYVRSWIAEWDLIRLYPGFDPEVQVEEVVLSYAEEPELETPPEEAVDEAPDERRDGKDEG